MEAVILIGIQGSGKSTFYRQRFAETHAHISLDVEKTRQREQAIMQSCLARGKPFVIDNTNVRAGERAIYIKAAKAAGFRVKGYFFAVELKDALDRNRGRSGSAVVPVAGVIGTLKRLDPPSLAEGFDELYVVTQDAEGGFAVTPWPEPARPSTVRRRIFLLSPANSGGQRGRLLLRPGAKFDLAVRLQREGAPLGAVYEFISDLYFRGKLAYARAFAAPPEDIPGTWVITSGQGLLPPETIITQEHLQHIASIPIDAADPRYRVPLERACRTLDELAGADCDYVLLGSVATPKYLEPISSVFGERLLFPQEFIGRGDMSRGGLLLRCVSAGEQLTYVPVGNLTRHGPRPPKLPRLRR